MSTCHDGHRERMRERFLQNNGKGMHEHELLEMLLYFSIPRENTNAIAHELIEKCGSFRCVFESSYDELLSVKGIGRQSALLIRIVSMLIRTITRYEDTHYPMILRRIEDTYAYLLHLYELESTESVYLLLFDNSNRLIDEVLVAQGGPSAAAFDIQNILRIALSKPNATSALLAHNHPHGSFSPSIEDINVTKVIKRAFDAVGFHLIEHIIVGNNGCFPLLRMISEEDSQR